MPSNLAHHRIRFTLKRLSKRRQRAIIKQSVLAVAVLEPLATIPQIYEVWVSKKTEGISLVTWSLYAGAAVVWLFYGLQLKDKPLIISSSLWIVTELAVVMGVVVF